MQETFKKADYRIENSLKKESSNKPGLVLTMILSVGILLTGISFLFRMYSVEILRIRLYDLMAVGINVLIWCYFLS